MRLAEELDLVGGIPVFARPVFRNDPEGREVAYDVGSTTLVTTQRCLPILRSRMNPSFS